MVTFFCQNYPWKGIGVLKLEQHNPVQTKSEYPTGVAYSLQLKETLESFTGEHLRVFYRIKIHL